jgi:uncharacterized repeat protein (TIGR01451 family)
MVRLHGLLSMGWSLICMWLVVSGTATATPLNFNVIDSDPMHPNGVWVPQSGTVLARDSAGRLIAAYTLATQQAVHYYNFARVSTDDGASWSAAVRTESFPDSSSSQSLTVDANDDLVLGYTFNVSTYVTRSTDHGASWKLSVPDIGLSGSWHYWPSLAFTTEGVLHAVYHGAFGWSDPPYNVFDAVSSDKGVTFKPAVSVTAIPNDDAVYQTGATAPVITAGPNGQLFMVYTVGVSASSAQAFLRRWDGIAWGAEIQVSDAGAFAHTSHDLAIDSKGILHIAFGQAAAANQPFEVRYRTYDPVKGELSASRRVSTAGDSTSYLSLGIYKNDLIIIAYDLYNATTTKYGGVKVVRSTDDFASAELISTHSEARAPSLRFQYTDFRQPEKADLAWIEINDVTGGEMLVHGIVGGAGTAPKVTGFRVQSFGPRVANPGQDATFLVQYENGRDQTLQDVTVAALLPMDLEYVSSTGGGQVRETANGLEVYWQLGNLAAGKRGYLGITTRIPWGIPEITGTLQLRAGAANGVGHITPGDYPASPKGAVSDRETLDQDAVNAWLKSNAAADAIVKRAKEIELVGPYKGERVQLKGGTEVMELVMVSKTGTAAVLYSTLEQNWLKIYENGGETTMDAEGGYRINELEGVFEPFGSWAVTHSPSFAQCLRNCALGSAPGWVAGHVSTAVNAVSTGIDCAMCAKSNDPDACIKCGGSFHNKLKDLTWFGPLVDSAKCAKDCKDPDKRGEYVCTEGSTKRECVAPGYNIAGLAKRFKNKATYRTMGCNAVAGMWEPIWRYQYCDPGQPCVDGNCVPTDDLCGLDNKADYEDTTCSLMDFDVVPAHDPNAKKVSPAGDVVAGETLTYTIEYENVGEGTAYEVFVLDTISDKLDANSVALTGGGTFSKSSWLASWKVGELASKKGGSVTLTAKVPEGTAVGTEIFNMAEVHFPSAGEITPTNPVFNVVKPIAAYPQEVKVTSGDSVSITLTGRGAADKTLNYAVVATPLHGELSGSAAAIKYSAASDFIGLDEFTFAVSQDGKTSEPARVVIDVAANPNDKVAPTVLITFPENGATDVPTPQQSVDGTTYLPRITATLSETIQPDSVTSAAISVAGVAGEVALEPTGKTLTFMATKALDPGQEYKVSVGAGVKDYAGNAAETKSFSFTTLPRKALRVAFAPGQTGVDFGDVVVGKASDQLTVTGMSRGIDAVTVSSVKIEGDAADSFRVADENCTSNPVQTGQSCFVTVETLAKTKGELSADLAFDTDATGDPVVVALKATAKQAKASGDSSGCSCRVAGSGSSVAGGLLCLGLLSLVFVRLRWRRW